MRVLLYGCGDFSHVIDYLNDTMQVLKLPPFVPFDPNADNPHMPVDLVATELRALTDLKQQYGDRVEQNITALRANGVNVALGVDATQGNSFGPFDVIIFRNPHAGTYGNSQDPGMSSYLESSTDNHTLFSGVLENTRLNREPRGLVLITVVGWPYVGTHPKGKIGLTGLQLEVPDYAAAYGEPAGLEFVGHIRFGTKWVARNTGDTFQAEELGILYRDNSNWLDPNIVEHILRATSPAELPAWINTHPDIEKIKAKIATQH
ncbi:Rossmann-like fold-containing protein [Nocardia sp. NPDC058058]|uniref:Rossmann-like fold-containing protein n=1 Tax=Nocardia sp. NPDC058058 TaxID=3346317 RepID=UPI0036DA4C71